MSKINFFRGLLPLIICFCFNARCYSQSGHTISVSSSNEDCNKGAAGIQIAGLQPSDTLTIAWSNGKTGVFSINELDAGNYSVHVTIKSKLDTTINIKIEKEDCLVEIQKSFTPNSDNYNDLWQIGNTQFYPKFELFVFNKWGQEVHSQKGSYTPWDGKWNGVHVADGTYYYVFYYDGGHKDKYLKGDITILR